MIYSLPTNVTTRNLLKVGSFGLLAFLTIYFSCNSVAEATALDNGPIAGTVIYMPENIYTGEHLQPLGNGGAMASNTQGTGGSTCAPYIQTFNTPGSRGDSVAQLQKFLNVYDGAQIPVTGYFGTRTKHAVQNFQARYGILVTGNQMILTTSKINDLFCQFGAQTVGKAPTAKPATACPVYVGKNVNYGDRNTTVGAIQLLLNVYENAGIPITGYFGKKTEYVLTSFQKKHALLPVSGQVNDATRLKLNELYCTYGGTKIQTTPSVTSVANTIPAVVKNNSALTNSVLTTDTANPTVTVTQEMSPTDGIVLGDMAVNQTTPTNNQTKYALMGLAGLALIAYVLQRRKTKTGTV